MSEHLLQSCERVLLIRPSALGDVCRTVPVAVSIKRALPAARLDWLVQRGFEDAVRHHPDVDGVIPFDRRAMSGLRWLTSSAGRSKMRTLRRELKGAGLGRFDAVVDCQGLLRSGLMAKGTGAALRLGERCAREGAARFYTHAAPTDPDAHTVDRMLGVIEHAGVPAVRDMRLYTDQPSRERAAAMVGRGGLVVVAPTSRWSGKRWPAERFVELTGALLSAGLGVERVAVVAAAGERDQCAALLGEFERDGRVIDLVGKTSVGELMAVIEASDLVIANDSAALHMAVGFDKPIVALFGPTSIGRVGPYGRDGDVLQSREPDAGVTHKDDAAGAAMMAEIPVPLAIESALARLRPQRAPAGAAGEGARDAD